MKKRILTWTKWLTVLTTGILTALLVLVGVILFTNPGLNVLVWAANAFVPQLTIEGHSGALFPRFSLHQVRYVDEDLSLDVAANKLTLAINPNCFTEPSVCIDEIAMDGLDFHMPTLPSSEEPAAAEEEDEPLTAITAPVPIQISRIALSNINLDILGNQIAWQRFSSGISFQGNRLVLSKTQLDGTRVALAPSDPQAPQAQSAAPDSDASSPIVLPDITLPLQIQLSRLDINDFRLEQETPLVVNHLGFSATARGSRIQVATLELDMPQGKANLRADVTLKGDYPLSASLDTVVKDPIANGQVIALNLEGSVRDLALDAELSGLALGQIEAHLASLDPDLPFELHLRDVDASWPLSGESDYRVVLPEFSAQGSLQGFHLNLQGVLSGKTIPELDLALKGQGDMGQIELTDFLLKTLGGEVEGSLRAGWQEQVSWGANLALSHIQPGLQWPQAEGDISGTLETAGGLTAQGGWRVERTDLNIDGLLRGYPLNIAGDIEASDAAGDGNVRAKTSGLVLSHGPNKIAAQGELDKQWDMLLTLTLPQLSKTVPDLKGQILGQVALSGAMTEPTLGLDINANRLAWQTLAQIGSTSIKGKVTPLPVPQGDLQLNVKQATVQGERIESVSLAFSGSQQQHKLSLDLLSELVTSHIDLRGALTLEPQLKWQGELEEVSFSTLQGEWMLADTTALGFDAERNQVMVAAHCWLQSDSALCLDEDIQVGESGEAALSLSQFNVNQLHAFIPPTTQLKAEVNANVWAKWSPETPPELKASVSMPAGQVTQKLEENVTLAWHAVTLNAALANNRLDADWLIDVRDNGDLSGQVTLPNVLDANPQIDAKLALTPFHIDFLAPLIGDFSELKSTISTDLAISGAVTQPKVEGQLLIDKMSLKGELSPVEVDSGRVSLELNGYDALLAAKLTTPDGDLELSGEAEWRELSNWSAQLRVYAEELLVNVPPMVALKVQPDMTISASPKLARVDGSIHLPWGRIIVEELPPSAIGVSDDQVLLDKDLQPVENATEVPFNLETNINISIGDEFKLVAFGLEGGLKGNLNVAQKDKGPFVQGEINIVDGSYRSFGQDLIISEGKILMNGPVDQPYVQITAIRNPDNTQDDVTAGVKVTGPADEPSVTIFSDPAMPQANALSYLLRGQDIDGEAGGNAMTTTLIGLSLAKSGKVVGEIGEAFGVQDLQLDTAGSGDDSQVTVSGYILPGLQVKYGVGIFDSVGEFTVRYRLMQDLYLEAVSGVNSAVDLLYQFEFD